MTGSVELKRLPSNASATDHPVACPPEDCSNGIVGRFYILSFLEKHFISSQTISSSLMSVGGRYQSTIANFPFGKITHCHRKTQHPTHDRYCSVIEDQWQLGTEIVP